jgi:putative tryptophan/tyrosine transport system substrate-binding protein
MNRRAFITLVSGAAAAWPLAARAQQPAMPVIGLLSSRARDESAHLVEAFHRGLAENGYSESRNVTIEYRWADGRYDQLPALAAELVRRPVTLLVSTGAEPSALAAKAATVTIPIVSTFIADPVERGLVASLNHPGGNVTGINLLTATMEPKRLGLLRDLVPQAATVGVLLNPNSPLAASQLRDTQAAAPAIGRHIHILRASTDREIDTAFESIAQQRIPALVVASDAFFITRREKLVALAAHYGVPAMYNIREYPVAGGLMSYGINLADAYRQLGVYAGRILKGAKPADLPVVQPTKFEFVINLKAAKALGVKISDDLLSLADEVIE